MIVGLVDFQSSVVSGRFAKKISTKKGGYGYIAALFSASLHPPSQLAAGKRICEIR
jgi:hypothetical protein